MPFLCPTCPAQFDYLEDANDHMDFYNHYAECETCTRTFTSVRACHQHMNDTGHWAPEYPCETCPSTFGSQSAVNNHMRALGHWRNHCKTCDRVFDNANNLKMHLNSKPHRGSSILCPFCKAPYTTASGLSHHLETFSCPKAPFLTRETIYRMVRARDPNGLITHKTIGWKDDQNGTYIATPKTWNGYGFECYICHREFKFLAGLNQHLGSAAHKQQVYKCPNGKCGKSFVALAGVFNHLESEACKFMRFERVQKAVGAVFNSSRAIAFQGFALGMGMGAGVLIWELDSRYMEERYFILNYDRHR